MQVKSSQVKARHAERAVSELVEESYKDFACSILVRSVPRVPVEYFARHPA
jgi:hypothetical protein